MVYAKKLGSLFCFVDCSASVGCPVFWLQCTWIGQLHVSDASTNLAQALLGPELYAQVEIVGRYVARYYAQESCDAS